MSAELDIPSRRLWPDRQWWMEQAECRGVNTELFYPTSGGTTQQIALSVCNTKPCPVRMECLEYALDTGEEWGIWGGTTARYRRKLWREHLLPRQCHNCKQPFFVKRAQATLVYCTEDCAKKAKAKRQRLPQQRPAIAKTGSASTRRSRHTHSVSAARQVAGGSDASD